MIDAGFDDSQQ
jgi:ATP-dependent RNA helicase DDX54/DBP10